MKRRQLRITRNRLHDQVVKHLALRIIQADTAASQQPVSTEGDLSRELNVSRTVLREAIKVLEAKGLVDVQQKVGVRIQPRSQWNLLDPDLLSWMCETPINQRFLRQLMELRGVLEPAAAQFAATRASKAEIAALFEHLGAMEKSREDLDSFVIADLEFHAGIFNACHNDLLEWINVTVGAAFRATMTVTALHRAGSERSVLLHVDVAEAIERQDPGGARLAMERLLQSAEKDLEIIFNQRAPLQNAE